MNRRITPSSNFYTVLTAAMGLAAIVFLFATQPAIAPSFTAIIVPFLVGIIGAVQQSKQNADKIGIVAEQLDENTAETKDAKQQAADTHLLVDGQAHEWRAAVEKIAALEAQIAALAGNAAGREEGRQIAIDLLAANAQVPERQGDGTLVVTAPALIAVRVPESE